MNAILPYANLVASSASGVASIIAVFQPASLSGSSRVSRGETFYARMYAARAVPLSVAAGLMPFTNRGPVVAWVLFTAGAIQALDVVIAIAKKDRGMGIGATVGTAIHFLCGFSML